MCLKVKWCAAHLGIVLGIGREYLRCESEGNEERALELVTCRHLLIGTRSKKGYYIVDCNFRFSETSPKRQCMGIMKFVSV